jgi:hypothetical protein
MPLAGYWLTPYTLEPVQWLVLVWLLVRWLRLRDDRLLLVLGAVAGVAAQTKFQGCCAGRCCCPCWCAARGSCCAGRCCGPGPVYGLWRLLRADELRSYRFLAVTFLPLYALFVVTPGRPYYLGGLYGVFAAAGALGLQ